MSQKRGPEVQLSTVDEFDEPKSPVPGTIDPKLPEDDIEMVVDEIEDTNEYKHVKGKLEMILLAMFVIYLLVGITFFSVDTNLPIDETLYYIVIIFTTVGYGMESDMNSHSLRVFLIFYVIAGVAIVINCFTIVMSNMTEQMLKVQEKIMKKKTEGDDEEEEEDMSAWGCLKKHVFKPIYLIWLVWTVAGALWIGAIEDWDFTESIYFAIVSGSSVGFGDYYPTQQYSRWVCIFYLPILIILTAVVFTEIFSGMQDEVFDQKMEEMWKWQKHLNKHLNSSNFLSRLQTFDVDSDGVLTLEEFTIQCLCMEYDVSSEKIETIKKRFRALDKDESGFITTEDFRQMSPRSKKTMKAPSAI